MRGKAKNKAIIELYVDSLYFCQGEWDVLKEMYVGDGVMVNLFGLVLSATQLTRKWVR